MQAYVEDLLAECFACFEQGLCYDEANDAEEACRMYKRGLEILMLAEQKNDCKSSENYKKLVQTRDKVQLRLKDGKIKSEAKRSRKGSDEKVLVKENLTNEIREQLQAADFPEAELIFMISDGVQLFMIEGDDATVPTIPSTLEIFKLTGQARCSTSGNADAFMKVGPWSYPLKAGKTPILKNEFGAYVMPNPTPDHPNMFVGILLPADLEAEIEKQFVGLLKQYADVRDQEITKALSEEERQRLSNKIANLLIKGSENVAWGVNFAAEKTSELVALHSTRFRSTVTPNEHPMRVNPLVRTGVYCVHGGSKVVAKCTKYLLNKIGDMGIAVGKTLASGAEKTFGGGNSGGLVSDTITVLAGGITGASTVWLSLENASKTLCRNIANETVETVRQKYGDDASLTTLRALYATGHTTLAALQLYDLGPRAIAGRAARKAGVQFVSGFHDPRMGRSSDLQEQQKSVKDANALENAKELEVKKKKR